MPASLENPDLGLDQIHQVVHRMADVALDVLIV